MVFNATTVSISVASPKSVVTPQNHHPHVEPISLIHNNNNKKKTSNGNDGSVIEQRQGMNSTHHHSQGGIVSEGDAWFCPVSEKANRTTNPIRAIVDPIVSKIKLGCQRSDGKDPISLALGDPTVSDNLPPCKPAMEAVAQALLAKRHAAGYVNACGTPEARHAVAVYHSYPEHNISSDNVIIANGCSGALELALTALLDPGTAVLIPQPGFPLYQVIAESHGASVIPYRLDQDRQWECDISYMEQIMERYPKHHIRALIINNPSNPTGAVYSERHLRQILEFANKHKLPILSDEVYGDLVFESQTFHPLAQIAARMGRRVPVITASGLAKQYLLPGWRVGWITFHDNIYGSLRHVEAGANRLAQVILGASHLAQTAIPTCLSPRTPGIAEWKQRLRHTLERQARFLCTRLGQSCHGLEVIMPQGAMYAIIKIHCEQYDSMIQDDMDFTKLLLEEENVFVLPGSAFDVENVFRVVFCSPEATLAVAADRIAAFCQRHAVV